jgi:hypothetical protein
VHRHRLFRGAWGLPRASQRSSCVMSEVPHDEVLNRPNADFMDHLCATLKPRRRARRASSSRPITVAARGWPPCRTARRVLGVAAAHGLEEDVFAQFHHARHHGAAAGEHDARGQHFLVADSRTTWCTSEKISSTRGSITPASACLLSMRGRGRPGRAPPPAASGSASNCLAYAAFDLDVLGVLGGRAQRHRDVAGDQVARDRDHGRVADRATGEDGHVGGAGADVHQRHAQLALVVGQHGLAGPAGSAAVAPPPARSGART